MQEKKELNWVNVAKAISIITVLFVHTENYYGLELGEINQFLCGFYVNAFFLISGYLLFRKQLNKPAIEAGSVQYIIGDGKKLMFNILYRMYIPMIIFSAIEFLPKIMITHRAFEFNTLLIETVGAGTYWFTSALLIAEVIIALLLVTRRQNIGFYVVVLGIISSIGIILACFFLGLGSLYWKYETWFDRVINKYTILLLIALYLYIAYLCPVAPRFMVSMGDMDVFGYFFGFLGSVILIWFCKQLPQIKTLTFVGRNSICFYFMSGALPITLSAIVKMFYSQVSPLGLFLIFGLTLIGAYIASLVIVKYLPWMLDIRKLRK
jgi:fucose 4-O-acetylase-like acetyltransferase